MSAPSRGTLLKYLATGAAFCVLLQVIFRLQIGSFRAPVAGWPFLLAYSQKAMLDLVVYDAPWPIQAGLWLLAYALIALLLWFASRRGAWNKAGHWGLVLLAWVSVEVALGLLGWALLAAGVLTME